MFRFSCPTCKKLLQATPPQAGQKTACPGCGQRLQVPAPPPKKPVQNKTVLGELTPGNGPLANTVAGGNPAPEPAPTWYYGQEGQQNGPITWTQLQQRAAAGQLDGKAQVWTQGMANWVPARSQPNLFATTPAPAGRTPGSRGSKAWKYGGLGLGAACCGLLAVLLILMGSRQTSAVTGSTVVRPNPPAPKPEPTRKPQPRPSVQETRKELTTREIVVRHGKSVAKISHPFGSGTAFVVRPGILATNAHVVMEGLRGQLQVYFPSAGEAGKKPLPVEEVLYFDMKRDLAFIRVKTDLPPVQVAAGYEFQAGQPVTAIGNPGTSDGETLDNAVSTGVLSTQRKWDKGLNYYQINMAINGGNSGGPVFDPAGNVIGVIVRKDYQREGIAYAIPFTDFQSALARLDAPAQGDQARAASDHRKTVVLRQLVALGKRYADGIDAEVKVVLLAIKNKQDPDQALAKCRQGNAKFFQHHQGIMNDLEQAVREVAADPNVAKELGRFVTLFWNHVQPMFKFVEGSDGGRYTVGSFAARARELIGKYEEIMKALRGG